MSRSTMTPERVLTRCLLKPGDVQPRFERFEVIGTFNPAAVEWNDGVVLLVRVAERPKETRRGHVALPYWDWTRGEVAIDWRREEDVEHVDPRLVRIRASGLLRLSYLSWLLVAFSRDGLTVDSFGANPFLPANRYETFGVEDPRLTRLGDRFYFTYVAVSEHGAATALASTADFDTFDRHGVIFCPENKDVVLFPEKVDDRYVALHRPSANSHFGTPEIWIARSPDLCHWGNHRRLLGAEVAWAKAKIGGGTPPIRTDRGWFTLFHGQTAADAAGGVGAYAAGALLLDSDRPEKTIGFSRRPVMVAEAPFERSGFLPDVVFPTAAVRREDRVLVYYGAADTASGVVQYSLSDLLRSVT